MERFIPQILEQRDIRLEPLGAAHRDLLAKAVAKTEDAQWRYMSKNAVQDFEGWLQSHAKAQEEGKRITFVIIDRYTGDALGTTSFMGFDYEHDRVEIGFTWYVPQAQGGGVNPACKLLLMEYAFDIAGAKRVELKCDALNERSRRAIKGIGAKEEGVLRQHMRVPDHKGGWRFRDTVYHSVLSEEWPQVRSGLENRLLRLAA